MVYVAGGPLRLRPALIFAPRFYAVQALLRSVAPIVTAEEELKGKAISEGWANISKEQLKKCLGTDQENLRSEVEELWDNTYDEEYARLFRRVSTHHCCASLPR